MSILTDAQPIIDYAFAALALWLVCRKIDNVVDAIKELKWTVKELIQRKETLTD